MPTWKFDLRGYGQVNTYDPEINRMDGNLPMVVPILSGYHPTVEDCEVSIYGFQACVPCEVGFPSHEFATYV